MTVPGGGTFGARSVDWVRQMGGSRVVAWLENVWYGYRQPPAGGMPTTSLDANGLEPGAVDSQGPGPPLSGQARPPAVASIAVPALPGEGVWQPIGRPVGGAPALYAAFLRPDPVHTSLTAGLVCIDPGLAELRLVAGSVQTGGGGWQDAAPLPPAVWGRLLATFNGGFRLADGRGGYYEAGRTARPLADGAASLVIRRDGIATVGEWGRDASMGPGVHAVRQNLSLVVDGGRITPAVSHDSPRAWGATVRNAVLVWRSGIGVTPSGALVYVARPGLSVQSLADILIHAGAERAMELDINSTWVDFVSFRPLRGDAPGARNGSKLLPGMGGDPGRYLGPSTRDFFAVLARQRGL